MATVLGQIAAMALSLFFNLKKNPEVQLTLRGFRPHLPTIQRIYAVGVPSILMSSIGSVMTLAINNILMAFSSTATAVFGVYFKLQSFVFMPVFGLNNGMVPIISYNYGARNKARVKATFRYAVIYATAIMLVGLAIFQLLPNQLLNIFNASDEMLRIGDVALRVISPSFLFAGAAIVASSMFRLWATACSASSCRWAVSWWCWCLWPICSASPAGWNWSGGPSPSPRSLRCC